jgi:uncharacterized protein involved in exopolysaccharide biosynthesis
VLQTLQQVLAKGEAEKERLDNSVALLDQQIARLAAELRTCCAFIGS